MGINFTQISSDLIDDTGLLTLSGRATTTLDATSGTSGTLEFQGGIVGSLSNSVLGDPGSTALNLIIGSNITLNGGRTVTINAPIIGASQVSTMEGVIVLTGANTYTGITQVSGGGVTSSTLTLSGSGSFAQSPTINVYTNCTLNVSAVTGGANFDGTHFALASGQALSSGLGNTGTVSGAVDVPSGAVIASGAITGTLNTSSVALLGTGTLQAPIDTTTLQAGLLNVQGNLTLDSANTTTLSLSDAGANAKVALGTVFTLLNYSGTWNGGTFAGLPNDGAFSFGANTYEISYNTVQGSDEAVTLEAVAGIVPEPSAAAFVAMGLLAFATRRPRMGRSLDSRIYVANS